MASSRQARLEQYPPSVRSHTNEAEAEAEAKVVTSSGIQELGGGGDEGATLGVIEESSKLDAALNAIRTTATSPLRKTPPPPSHCRAEDFERPVSESGLMGFQILSQQEGECTAVLPAGAVMLVIPMQSTRVVVVSNGIRSVVDRSSWLVLPPGVRSHVEATSPIAHTLVLSITPSLQERTTSIFNRQIEPLLLTSCLSTTQLMVRSSWVSEICQRYVLERTTGRNHENTTATLFLETEIVKEVYLARTGGPPSAVQATNILDVGDDASSLVKRAVAVIEADLFEPSIVQTLVKACAASASTLLRAFKRELGRTPLSYVRARRLDESLLLLKAGRFTVSEVAVIVGYRNFPAFSEAFRTRFGVRPSEVRKTGTATPRSRRRGAVGRAT